MTKLSSSSKAQAICVYKHMKCLEMALPSLAAGIVEEPGFKNVKNKHLGMPPF